MAYRLVNLEQGSPQWHAWRATRYTASLAPAVMSCNPWFPRTPRDLYRARTGQQEVFVTKAMQRGNDVEPRVRQLLVEAGYTGVEPICAEAEVNGLPLGASLDGVALTTKGKGKKATQVRVGLEVKTPNRGSESELWSAKKIPEHYRWQMLHQAAVVDDLEEVLLVVYAHDIDQFRIVGKVTREDVAEGQGLLLAAWRDFDDHMTAFREPPAGEGDVVEVGDDDAEVADAVVAFEAAKALEAQAADAIEKARTRLQELAQARGNGMKVLVPGWQVYKSTRAGNVNWKAKPIVDALVAAKVNPDDYRAASTEFWTIKERAEA